LNNAEHLRRWTWENIQATAFKLNFKSLSLSQYQQTGALFINQGKNIFISYVVAESVLNGQLTLGTMLAIQYIIGQLNGPVEQIVTFSQRAQDAKISFERLNEIHQLKDEEPDGKFFVNEIAGERKISLHNVTFCYPGSDNIKVLSALSTEFPAGKITAIVGLSGSGKTTLLKLIQNFYDNYEGEIKVGDINLRRVRPQYWRSVVGSVMQDGFIFSDTIERNIALGDETPNPAGILRASRLANILDFIEALPQGFSTLIGPEGVGLSSGQKQRLLIARAIYKNPEIILFDEATNALDAFNEQTIIHNLKAFFGNKTVIIVAHRLSTVKAADKIIVLDQGKIVEEGNIQELHQLKGRYYELVKNQMQEVN
jgi:ATP-binding cassette, subfamily B, bacterial